MGAKISSHLRIKLSSRKSSSGWSELPRELLEMILEKLDLVAHARFASVCSSWRSVAAGKPPINKPLYLALSHNPENLVRRFIASFVPQRSWKEAWFIGAGPDGWLVLLIDREHLFLVNKAFNSIIPLPPPPPDVDHLDPEYSFRMPQFSTAVLSSPPPLPASSSSSSSGECTVVLKRCDCSRYLFYCRLPSDKSFSKLSVSDSGDTGIHDILFYKGQLYVACSDDLIIVFDHLLNKVTQLPMCLDNFTAENRRQTQLLISENKLIMLIGVWECERIMYLLFQFEQSESRFIRVDYINGSLMLLNPFCSVSVAADLHKEFRRNFDRISTYSTYPNHSPFQTSLGIVVLQMRGGRDNGYPWPLFFFMFNQLGIH